MAKDKPDLLKKLGWSREEAQRFYENWRKMQEAAGQQGEKGKAARKSLDEAIKSLGLRPRGTRLKPGQTSSDRLQNLRGTGRFDPPSDWAEQFRAFSRGVAGNGR
jgi:hypothetical protein